MNNNYAKNALKYLLKNRFVVYSSSFNEMYSNSTAFSIIFATTEEKPLIFCHILVALNVKMYSGMHRYEPQSPINREIGCSKQLLRLSLSRLFFGIALVMQHLVSLPSYTFSL